MNTLQHRGQYEEELHESPLLKTTCRYPAVSSQMNQKIETASTVLSQYIGVSTSYKYDAKGHLVEASTPTCYEDYSYNSIGQRISMLHTRKGIFHYTYDAQGKLAQVNDTRFQYDPLGRLSGTTAPNIPAKRFVYERVRIGELDIDRLATFQDSTGKSYTYSYTPNNPLPIAVHRYGQPVVTYQWDESGALPRLLGCTTPFATWQFGYLPENDGRLPDTVILTGPVVAKLGYWDLKSLQCKLGYDHLGTVKLIADPFNELVKELFYDSFGNIVSETEQRIYFPLGFAGGLRDIATDFVCFGFRDYDPSVGRFTTPDPALDVRGDGDIYDYCVDDPVNLVDEAGLRYATWFRQGIQFARQNKLTIKHYKNTGPRRANDTYSKPTSSTKTKKTGEKNNSTGAEVDNLASPSPMIATGTPDVDIVINSIIEGAIYGARAGKPFKALQGAVAGAVINGLLSPPVHKAAKKIHKAIGAVPDFAEKHDINSSDSTSIDPFQAFPHGALCTPDSQPRTPDGRYTYCNH